MFEYQCKNFLHMLQVEIPSQDHKRSVTGAGSPRFFENYNYITSSSAVYNTRKSERKEKFCLQNFSQNLHEMFSNFFKYAYKKFLKFLVNFNSVFLKL